MVEYSTHNGKVKGSNPFILIFLICNLNVYNILKYFNLKLIFSY